MSSEGKGKKSSTSSVAKPKAFSIALEGVIGVGKTTLGRALSERLGAVRLEESAIHNPFLPLFYKHKQRWALTCQLAFLEGRLEQFNKGRPVGLPVVADHSLAKELLFARINLENEDEWDLYHSYYQRLAPSCSFQPRVTIFLTASLAEVRNRIVGRGRKMEFAIEMHYLEQLVEAYDAYFDSDAVSGQRIVVVNADGANIAQDPDAVDRLIDACRQARPGISYCNPEA